MIVITGSGGLLGRALAAELAEGAEPYAALTSADADLRDEAATLALFQRLQPRLVLHLAGRVHGLMGNRRYPASMFTDNVRINTSVIDAAYRAGCEKVVAASTVAAYATSAPMPVREGAIWDGPPGEHEAAYGHAKRAMLAQLEAYAAQHGLGYAYAILTNLYGPHDRFDPVNGHVVPSLIAKFHRAATGGGGVSVWGTGAAERDFMAAADAARALLLIAGRHSGPINVATGRPVPIRNVVEVLSRHAGVGAVEWDADKPDGQLLRRYDVSKLAALGFTPRVALDQGLAATYDWYAARYPEVRT